MSTASALIRSAQLGTLLVLSALLPQNALAATGSGSGTTARPAELRVQPAGPVQSGGRYALVIGINDYQQAGMGSLRFSERDAIAMRDVLVSVGGFERDKVRLLLGKEATDANIMQFLARLGDPAIFPAADTFVLYFSGHGGVIDSRNAGGSAEGSRDNYLIPFNGSSDPVLAQRRNIPLDEVKRLLDQSVFKRKVVFLDACRDVLTVGARGGGIDTIDLSRYAHSEGLMIMTGTKHGEVSWEDAALGHGVFTACLLEGLQGKAAGPDGIVTFNLLEDYTAQRMAAWSRLNPDKAQTPQVSGEGLGAIPLTLAAATGAASLPPSPLVPAPAVNPAPTDSYERLMDFVLDDFHGNQYSSNELLARGRLTLICSWGSGCPPCNAALEFFGDLSQEYRSEDLNLVVVCTDTPLTIKHARSVISSKRLDSSFTVLFDTEQKIRELAYPKPTIPKFLLMDSEGRILFRHDDFYQEGDKPAEQKIRAAIRQGLAP